MNRIDSLFLNKKERVLSVYMTAGYPALNDTQTVIHALEDSGADLIEIGMPFSDPLADGPVIQESSQRALQNGMTIKVLFEQLADIRQSTQIPLVLMGYLNPVMQFGFDLFLEKCQYVGIDGLILPDLPLTIYERDYRAKVEAAGVKNIMLITPQTSEERITRIANASDGFLYMVSASSTTGARGQIKGGQIEYFQRIRSMKLSIPRLIGFGISTNDTFEMACTYANGAIIGSAFIRALSEINGMSLEEKTKKFIESIRPTYQH